ncbi:hypothetical protein KSP9073_00293 [Kushneria phyllosphaerae]|uniref:Uncharacterized protein n=1 Tax=Kushneria phyllosphaerae TaxID=2100822 RepID=A0A2R8CHE8_9GAMM|nr:hypothetical protein KSP9073_00293 [Kushneria phyllosphaerae]
MSAGLLSFQSPGFRAPLVHESSVAQGVVAGVERAGKPVLEAICS